MVTSPSVSVILPLFNREDLVVETLESIRAQTLQPAEVLVIDDRSTDRSAEVVRAWAGRTGLPVRVEPNRRRKGMSGALNSGLALARGEFVAFQDSDDLWLPDHLRQLAGVLTAFPRINMAFSRIEVFGSAADTAEKSREFSGSVARCLEEAFHHWDGELWLSHDRLLASLLRRGVPFRCQASMSRRSLIERCRLNFDEDITYTLDAQFMTMAACHTPFAYVDRTGLRLRRHQGNDGDRSYGAEILRSYRERARKLRYYFSGMPLTKEARRALGIRLVQLYGAGCSSGWNAMDTGGRVKASVDLLFHMPSWLSVKTVMKKWMGA